MYKYLLCLLGVGLFAGCQDRLINPGIDSFEPRLAVIATLADSVRMQVLLSTVVDFTTESFRHAVPDATVELYEDDKLLARLHAKDDEWTCASGCAFIYTRYLSDGPLTVTVGATYHVVVSAPGFPEVRSEAVTAERQLYNVQLSAAIPDEADSFPDPNHPDARNSRVDRLSVAYGFRGDSRDQIALELYSGYRIDTIVPRYFFPWPEESIELPSSADVDRVLVDPFEASVRTNWDRSTGPNVTLDLVRYPADFRDFWDAVKKQRSTSFLPGASSASPATIPNRMRGGYGFFTILEHYQLVHVPD